MRRRERGVALLTVLLLVAAMTLLVVAVLDDMRFAVRGTDNSHSLAQAQWHALGAEALAQVQIERLAARDRERTTLDGGWNGRPFVFPVEGGTIRAQLRDGGNCFNLNSVVAGTGNYFVRRDEGVRQLRALLLALQVPAAQAEGVAGALADWIDSDDVPAPDGAEDSAYLRGRGGYRTGGTLLGEASELRAVRGVTPALYARLRPHACALPLAGATPLNVNTLDVDEALLLVMLGEGRLDAARARAAIAARPRDGWRNLSDFWTQPALAGIDIPPAALEQAALRTRWFALHAEVEYGTAQTALSALFQIDDTGQVRRLQRRWTADE